MYLRADAFDLIVKVRSTAGVRLAPGVPAETLRADTEVGELGQMLLHLLGQPAEEVPHPAQDEWTDQRKRSLGPLMAQTKVRSWRAFERGAALVSVNRVESRFTVSPKARDATRDNVWCPVIEHEQVLDAPDSVALGQAVASALRV